GGTPGQGDAWASHSRPVGSQDTPFVVPPRRSLFQSRPVRMTRSDRTPRSESARKRARLHAHRAQAGRLWLRRHDPPSPLPPPSPPPPPLPPPPPPPCPAAVSFSCSPSFAPPPGADKQGGKPPSPRPLAGPPLPPAAPARFRRGGPTPADYSRPFTLAGG